MKKSLKYLLILVLLLFLFAGYTYYPALNIVTGYASKNMASGLFLAKRDQLSMEKQDNGFLPINFASYVVDAGEKSVSASIFGLMKRKAIEYGSQNELEKKEFLSNLAYSTWLFSLKSFMVVPLQTT